MQTPKLLDSDSALCDVLVLLRGSDLSQNSEFV